MPHEINNLLLGHLIIGLASLHASLLNLQPYHKSITFPTPPFKIKEFISSWFLILRTLGEDSGKT